MMMRIPGWLTGRGRQAVSTPATVTQAGQGGASGFYAVRSGRDMMQTSERQRLIRMLSDNSPLSGPLTQTWWLRPLEELTARVQACPAAWSGPFSGPGGPSGAGHDAAAGCHAGGAVGTGTRLGLCGLLGRAAAPP
ncbi:hypothetical protein LU604_01815 [Erwinia tracheiphila]|uniref:hypothetical protein n=1 Tax=Erwinia tracheiphila TaxID=65700 RepID=UPI001F2E60C5|nr:hypothetical protein [Erwinia tracheiphila]UIA83875.1 hypothetical protein LU604_01815 [Erwinia tracheiphila]